MLELQELSVAYGPVRAVEGLSLHVAAGEVVALVGANGAGKSSTLKAVAGMAPVARGRILLGQVRIDALPAHGRPNAGIALSPEGRQVFPDMSVLENLEMGAAGAGRSARGRTFVSGRDRNRATVRGVFDGILDEVSDQMVELAGVASDHRSRTSHNVHRKVSHLGQVRQTADDFIHDR